MKKGFSLIEITIVIMIIGVMMSIITPRLFKTKEPKVDSFVNQLNIITQLGSELAIKSNSIKKIQFDIQAKKINLESLSGSSDRSTSIPNELEITDFFVNDKSVFSAETTRLTAYFLIDPEGLTQNTSIIIDDTEINKTYKLDLNPFTKKFKINYD